MNAKLIKSLIELSKTEELSRENARSSMSPDAADCQATFYDTPLTNELYLLVLLFMWHEIEKEILLLAALSGSQATSPITRDEYRKEVVRLETLRPDKRKKELEKRLPALDQGAWDLLDVLRLLANSFKHDPFDKPSDVLLNRNIQRAAPKTIKSATQKMTHSALSSGMIFQSQLPLMSVSRPCLPSRSCQPHARVGVAKPTLPNPLQVSGKQESGLSRRD